MADTVDIICCRTETEEIYHSIDRARAFKERAYATYFSVMERRALMARRNFFHAPFSELNYRHKNGATAFVKESSTCGMLHLTF